MRFAIDIRKIAWAGAALCVLGGDAPAQTVLQGGFSFGDGRARPIPFYRLPEPQAHRDLPAVEPAPGASSPDQGTPSDHGDQLATPDVGPYVTMCVRSCDGFYFPLRQNAGPQNFAHDAQACSLRCGSQARLFYFPLQGGGPGTMVDLTGRKYADEPQAFAFRNAIKPNCACSPAPWSREAAARHQQYLAAEVEARLRAEALLAERAAAEAGKTSAAISAAAASRYFESERHAPKSLRPEDRPIEASFPSDDATAPVTSSPRRPHR